MTCTDLHLSCFTGQNRQASDQAAGPSPAFTRIISNSKGIILCRLVSTFAEPDIREKSCFKITDLLLSHPRVTFGDGQNQNFSIGRFFAFFQP
jgi:hypothetical protein